MNTRSNQVISLLVSLSLGTPAFASPATPQSAPPAAATTAPVAAVRAAATVVMITGRGMALGSDGALRTLSKGSAVYEGELVTTGPSTYLNLRFVDQSLFLLRPNTRFQIEEYNFEAQAAAPNPARDRLVAGAAPPRPETAFFRLLKGGFRAVTGAVGKTDRERFRVTTPLATIGIRGTDFEVRWCDGDCDDAGLNERDGLSAYTAAGAITLFRHRGPAPSADAGTSGWPGYSGMTRLETLAPQGMAPSVGPLASFYFAGEETISLLGLEMPLEVGVGILLVGGAQIVGGVGAGIYAYRENEQDDRDDRHSQSVYTEGRPSTLGSDLLNPIACGAGIQ